MEDFNLSSLRAGFLSVLLGVVPDLAHLNTWADLGLKFASLVSVLLIIFLNLKKLRTHANA